MEKHGNFRGAFITETCKICGSKYSHYKSIKKLSCSTNCTSKLKKQIKWDKYKQVCLCCGKEFMPKRPREGQDYCSYVCSGLNNRRDRISRNGYWYKYMPEHPNSSKQGYVPEHHLVVEESIGDYIADGYVVHHINFNKKDNNLENLIIMTDSSHKSLHMKEQCDRGIMHTRKKDIAYV